MELDQFLKFTKPDKSSVVFIRSNWGLPFIIDEMIDIERLERKGLLNQISDSDKRLLTEFAGQQCFSDYYNPKNNLAGVYHDENLDIYKFNYDGICNRVFTVLADSVDNFFGIEFDYY